MILKIHLAKRYLKLQWQLQNLLEQMPYSLNAKDVEEMLKEHEAEFEKDGIGNIVTRDYGERSLSEAGDL